MLALKGVAFFILVSGPFADTDYLCSEVDRWKEQMLSL